MKGVRTSAAAGGAEAVFKVAALVRVGPVRQRRPAPRAHVPDVCRQQSVIQGKPQARAPCGVFGSPAPLRSARATHVAGGHQRRNAAQAQTCIPRTDLEVMP